MDSLIGYDTFAGRKVWRAGSSSLVGPNARVQDAVGWRRNELLNLERRRHMNLHVGCDEGYLELDGSMTKNGEPRRAYVSGVALEALRRWDRRAAALERKRGEIIRHVFHRDGKPVRSFPYDLWHLACEKAGITERRIPHDFRRTAARRFRRSGVTEGVIMEACGWRTRAVFERYNIKNDDDLRDAARRAAAQQVADRSIGKKWEKQDRTRPLRQVQKGER